MYFCHYVGLVFVVCWNASLMHMSILIICCIVSSFHFSLVFSTFISGFWGLCPRPPPTFYPWPPRAVQKTRLSFPIAAISVRFKYALSHSRIQCTVFVYYLSIEIPNTQTYQQQPTNTDTQTTADQPRHTHTPTTADQH